MTAAEITFLCDKKDLKGANPAKSKYWQIKLPKKAKNKKYIIIYKKRAK